MSRGKTNLRKKPGFRFRRNRRRTTVSIAPATFKMPDGTERLLSRRHAEQMVAMTEDEAFLIALSVHANKHVRKNAEFKLKLVQFPSLMENSS